MKITIMNGRDEVIREINGEDVAATAVSIFYFPALLSTYITPSNLQLFVLVIYLTMSTGVIMLNNVMFLFCVSDERLNGQYVQLDVLCASHSVGFFFYAQPSSRSP